MFRNTARIFPRRIDFSSYFMVLYIVIVIWKP